VKHQNTRANFSGKARKRLARNRFLITDGLHAYHVAYKREFYAHKKPVTQHREHVTWQGDKGNQKMEAFNGTVRAKEKVMRSLKRKDSPILDGYQIFHNHMRPHMALNQKTPGELAGIQVKGDNKWITMIQNASLHHSRLHVPR
jgi:hypothetical protein